MIGLVKEVAALLPYEIENGVTYVFLNKRHAKSRLLPGNYSFFGGKLEPGETVEQALVREIKEELNFDLQNFKFLGRYQGFTKEYMLNIHMAQVASDFESQVQVLEGEGGKFFSKTEVMQESLITDHDKKILADFFNVIKNPLNK